MRSRLISSQEMALPLLWHFANKTVVPVKPCDLSGHALTVSHLLYLCTRGRLFMVVFPSEPVVTAGVLVLFCYCSGFWNECVSNIDGPCQRPLDDASSCTTTPRCLASFTNRLSSLFGALLVWHDTGHVHQSAEISRFLL